MCIIALKKGIFADILRLGLYYYQSVSQFKIMNVGPEALRKAEEEE